MNQVTVWSTTCLDMISVPSFANRDQTGAMVERNNKIMAHSLDAKGCVMQHVTVSHSIGVCKGAPE